MLCCVLLCLAFLPACLVALSLSCPHRLVFLPAALMQGCVGCHRHTSNKAALLLCLSIPVHAFPTFREKTRSCAYSWLSWLSVLLLAKCVLCLYTSPALNWDCTGNVIGKTLLVLAVRPQSAAVSVLYVLCCCAATTSIRFPGRCMALL